MYTLLIPHLGESTPPYLRDCIHQLRLWNPPADLVVILLLERCHQGAPFWSKLAIEYTLAYMYTDQLEPTKNHELFQTHFQCDTKFRNGYWKYVVERFFYLEECMVAMNLKDAIAIEYDILIYTHIPTLIEKLKAKKQTLRMVRDNPTRGHPGFLYMPTVTEIGDFCRFVTEKLKSGMGDMQLLNAYAITYPAKMSFFPVITSQRNTSPRQSLDKQHRDDNAMYLSEDSDYLGMLFDSAVVGQYVGGIDPRNTGGQKVGNYLNEGALYSIPEMSFGWAKTDGKWQPYLDDRPLATIHLHCKALDRFLSDRPSEPTNDYNVSEVLNNLVKN